MMQYHKMELKQVTKIFLVLAFYLVISGYQAAESFGIPRTDRVVRGNVALSLTAKKAEEEVVSMFKNKFSSRRKTRPIDESILRKTFKEMSKVYGLENAYDMSKTELRILEMEPSYFKGTFDIFCETFGKEDTIAMVKRNPGLLATAPEGYGAADTAGPETMFLSYVVAATRPLGPYLLALLFALLLTPTVETLTGATIRPF